MQGKRRDSSKVGRSYQVFLSKKCYFLKSIFCRWHSFCKSLHSNATLCVTDTFGILKYLIINIIYVFIQTGKNKLTVPKYSNVCDALCHMRINRKMGICPEVKEGEPKPILPENYKWVECYCNLNIHIYPRIPSLCSVKGCTWCIALCTIASNCSHITTNSTMCSVKGCTNNYDIILPFLKTTDPYMTNII